MIKKLKIEQLILKQITRIYHILVLVLKSILLSGKKLILCSNRKITDNGIIFLMRCIGENLKKLEYLGLNFSYFSKLTDVGVNSIATAIGDNLKRLQHLDINLSYCKHVTDHGLRELALAIGNGIPNLQELVLGFWK